jgi:hypothetical protein
MERRGTKGGHLRERESGDMVSSLLCPVRLSGFQSHLGFNPIMDWVKP